MATIETDYLVVGAGAAGMAFTDSLITGSDSDAVLVDRRHRPGGHWHNAYPFVRLHQPAAFYGVNSRVLGSDSIDIAGPNAGMYERVTGVEILDYFQRVLDEQFLPSGQVRFFGMCDYLGEQSGTHQFESRLTGEITEVRVRQKLVDATYLETPVPSLHSPSFTVDPDVRFMPVNDLVSLSKPGSRFTVIGAGKTAMDACTWLLENEVDPDLIRWIRPRDAWLLDRTFTQPLELVGSLMEGVSLNLQSAAEAESVDDLFLRLEACGQLIRLDPAVNPTMYRCATVSQGEIDSLGRIRNVIRQGRVRNIGSEQILLEEASIPTDRQQVHIDCTAAGLRVSPARPIFEQRQITLQQIRTCQPTFNAALVGYLESAREDLEEKNRLCPPNPYPDAAIDWLTSSSISWRAQAAWNSDTDLGAWLESSRLNAARGIAEHMAEPQMQTALARYLEYSEPAIENLDRLTVRGT
jgi:hypothetical protein